MDNYDELSNNELRDKLKAAGLGNIPVTDTTRKLLIKKLRGAAGGGDKPSKRRETVNVVKHTSDDSESDADAKKASKSKSASNRRTTIAAVAAPKPNNATNGVADDKIMPKPAEIRPKSPSRRTIAAPASKSVAPPVAFAAAPVVSKPVPVLAKPVPVLAKPVPILATKDPLFDNSDDDLVAAAEAAEKISKIPTKRLSRSSRSPSLSKSTTVSTSYKHIIEPLIEQDVIVLNDESDEEFVPELTEKLKRRNTPTTKIVAGPDSRRKTLQTGPTITANYTSISQPTTTAEDAVAAYRRRYTTNTPVKPTKETDEELLKRVETPYLSDFIKRLADLKADPLPGTETYDYRATPSATPAYRREYRSSVHQKSLSSGSGSGSGSIAGKSLKIKQPDTVWTKFEKKVRLPLLILLAIFVVVSVYVFFFSSF